MERRNPRRITVLMTGFAGRHVASPRLWIPFLFGLNFDSFFNSDAARTSNTTQGGTPTASVVGAPLPLELFL
jgi:hypothetical protein